MPLNSILKDFVFLVSDTTLARRIVNLLFIQSDELQMASKGPKLRCLPFDPHGDRVYLGKRWEKWLECFERELYYNGVDPNESVNSGIARMAKLMHVDYEVEDIHDTLPENVKPKGVDDEHWMEYDQSKAKLLGYFHPLDLMILPCSD